MPDVVMPMRLKFDRAANPEDYLFVFDVRDGQITGEVRSLDNTTKISDLSGFSGPGVNPLNPRVTVINFIFQLRGDMIFLGGRIRGIFYDGRLRAFTPRVVPGFAAPLLEPGDTGTGGGGQTTFTSTKLLDRRGAA